MLAQLLICDDVQFMADDKQFALGRVINAATVPTLPYVLKMPIFVKLFYVPTDRTFDMHFVVRTSDGKVLAVTGTNVLRNYRSVDQVPGVDTSVTLTHVICQADTYILALFIDGEEVSSYPLTVRIESERIGA